MTETQLSTVAVTSRTEYLGRRHIVAARVASVCMVAGLVALVVCNAAGLPGGVTATVVAVLLLLCLAATAFGRLGRRGAALLTVDSDTVYLGDEGRSIDSHPLAGLRSVSLGSMAEVTGAAGSVPRDLTIKGVRTLTVEFDPAAESADATPVRWRIGVVESDPAAAEVISRLRTRAPAPRRRQPEPHADLSADEMPDDDTAPGPLPTTDGGGDPSEEPLSSTPRVADAGSDEAAQRLWEEATRRHDSILRDYGTYELQPDMMLRFPGVTDVTLAHVQVFHDALDTAMALRTDTCPRERSRADAYQQSVFALRRAWIACEKDGRRLGTSYLETADQDDLDMALKLFAHAQSSTIPAEQASYYTRVHDIVTTLTDQGRLHPPEPAVAELKAATRRAIAARPPTSPRRPDR
ncbi:hypothetical protein QSJ19_14605 [Gordonia sp. ABSL11-1]|uniref:hypothetical protein n=1 Tax=Gordonia sp. ABSL11-1 TaxID=3053924 RepID=UPI002572CF4B|nr:hypothetical protein [Gordonia sp. ABSL11-1]MDL9946798.1 hypothetical protein [Gordonia sp. ABSL11-1]